MKKDYELTLIAIFVFAVVLAIVWGVVVHFASLKGYWGGVQGSKCRGQHSSAALAVTRLVGCGFDQPRDFFRTQDHRHFFGFFSNGRSSKSRSRRFSVFLYRNRSAPMRSAIVPTASFFSRSRCS